MVVAGRRRSHSSRFIKWYPIVACRLKNRASQIEAVRSIHLLHSTVEFTHGPSSRLESHNSKWTSSVDTLFLLMTTTYLCQLQRVRFPLTPAWLIIAANGREKWENKKKRGEDNRQGVFINGPGFSWMANYGRRNESLRVEARGTKLGGWEKGNGGIPTRDALKNWIV